MKTRTTVWVTKAHGVVHFAIQAFLIREVLYVTEIKTLTLLGIKQRSRHLQPLAYFT